ncbi:MAG: F0F1 ATP synthase subunit gamma [Xanthomonadales bacterium]|nr:F0F1 ATP synthase subunit gamma [Gammaproteobacteria bacterium]MBT8051153.1 F0F1 ATP synthase subunit gamma [Gammaproteobacteria bacterium]MBT8056981.1 F0F1 ATP synthase subunit gamma [Gammaproteobacteria bacterium]NNJ77668.1 F0F1 ATP synthase subunit gamma [Xanthomonadales bacterium]NNL04871.1 F0F1 ATP synthase subunit gamma [Xanthomonadales bacterium]
MAGGKEITTKIRSIENTRKVTSALEMVSASKIRKSQDLMAETRPYAKMIRRVMGHLSKARPEYRHPFTMGREQTNKVGYIIVSTDRGLCGGLNTNLFKMILADMAEWKSKGADVSAVTLGKKASAFFKNIKVDIAAHASDLGEKPQIEDLIGSIKVMLDAYRKEEIDLVYIVYNRFENTMSQKPVLEQLLPLPETDDDEVQDIWDYIYEPDAETLLDTVITRYIEADVYHAVLENLASEHAARMIAMKNATENAGELIDELTLVFNKARQAAITQEISEIVGGAAAV